MFLYSFVILCFSFYNYTMLCMLHRGLVSNNYVKYKCFHHTVCNIVILLLQVCTVFHGARMPSQGGYVK